MKNRFGLRALAAGIIAVSFVAIGHVFAQVFNPPAVVEVTNVTAASVQVQMPALPDGATSLSLQRATVTSPVSTPPASDLALWLKADAISGVGNGGSVSQWASVDGHLSAEQSSATSRPTLIANSLGGRPAVHFDGVDDFLSLPTGMRDFSQGLSAFVVTKPTATTNNARLFDFGAGNYNDAVAFARWGTNPTSCYVVWNQGAVSYVLGDNALGGTGYSVQGVVQQGGAPSQPSAVTLYRNGSAMGAGQTFVPRILDRTTNYIGKCNAPGELTFQGDIAEILIYNRAVSAGERQDIQNYLSAKYSLPSASSGTNWTTVASNLSAGATFTDTTVAADTTYSYRCVAVNQDSNVPGAPLSVQTLPLAPDAPGQPTFDPVAATWVRVSAPPLSARATNLALQRKLPNESDNDYVTVSQAVTGTTLVRGLAAQTEYSFRFVAIGEGGSTFGPQATVTTLETDPLPMGPPDKVTVTGATASRVSLQMPPLPTGAASLTLQRAEAVNPVSLPSGTGRVLWLNADSIVGSGAVSQWGNSGMGTQATQSNPDFRPTLITGGLNGHSVVRFDGVDDYLNLPAGMRDFSQGITTFIVTKPTASANNARFFEFGNGTYNDRILLVRWGTSSDLCHMVSFHDVTSYTLGGNSISNNSYQLLGSVQQGGASHDQSSVKIYSGGLLTGMGQAFVPRVIERTNNLIGKSNWPDDHLFQGDIAEVIVYNRALGDAERQGVEAYLSGKYGLSSPSATGPWTTLASNLNGSSAFEDTTVSPDTTYFYRAVAIAGTGITQDTAEGPPVLVKTPVLPPAAPDQPSFSDVAATQVKVNTPQIPARATHLVLQRKGATEPNSGYVTLTQSAPNVYSASGLTAQTAYSFRYVAVGEGGQTPGQAATVTTVQLDPPAAPAAPLVQSVLADSIRLKMPPLPVGASTLTLQKAVAPVVPPPTSIGLTLWLKADSLTAVNGSPTATWADSSGAGNDATQTEPGRQPTLATNGLNGLPIVHLDGINDYLHLVPQTGVRTAIILARHKTGTQDWNPILGGTTGHFHGGFAEDLFSWQWTSPQVKGGQSFENGIAANVLDLQKPTQFRVISLITTGAALVDTLSAQLDAERFWNGDYAEVLLYNRVLSTEEREQAENYLKTKYQIADGAQNWNWTTAATGLAAGATRSDTGLTPGIRYFYRCVAVNTTGSTVGSVTSATTLPMPQPPVAPDAPTFSDLTTESVVVIAPDFPDRARSLSLQQKLATEEDTEFHTIATGVEANSQTSVSNLSPVTGYSFRFVAIGLGGNTPGASASIQTPSAAISGFQWSSDGEQWNPITGDTILRVERFSHIGVRAVKTTPNSPWPGGLSGPVWSWQGTRQEGEEVWLTGERVTNGAPDEATALLNNALSVRINVVPKVFLYMSLVSTEVSAPAGAALTDAVPVTIVARDTDGFPIPFMKVRVSAVNAKDDIVGLWGSTNTATPQRILTADGQGQIQTNWFGPDNAGHIQLKAVAVDGDSVPFGDGDSKDVSVTP